MSICFKDVQLISFYHGLSIKYSNDILVYNILGALVMIIIIIFKYKKCNILGKCDFFQQYQYSSYNYKIPSGASSFNTISAKVSTSLIVVFFTLFLFLLNSNIIIVKYSLIAFFGGRG